jgi:hypothetical protein
MTYIVLFVLLCSFFVTPQKTAHAGVLSRPPSNLGLVGYWPMDEGVGSTVGDASGQRNTGAITGATWANGKHGKALSFNGSSYAKSANTNFITAANQPWSGSAWVYLTSTSTAQAIWSYGEFNDNAASAGFGIGTNGNLHWFWNGVQGVQDSGLLVPLNRWSFVSVVRNPTTIDFNVNGQTATVGQAYSGGIGAGNPQQIGYSSKNQIQEGYFSGKIDDVRLYNRALTASEISKLYSNPGSVKMKNIIRVGSASNGCGLGTSSCTVTYSPTAGNFVEVMVSYRNDASQPITSLTDNANGGSSTYQTAFSDVNVGTHYTLATYYVCSVKSGVSTITANFPTNGDSAVIVTEYSGIAPSSCLDKVSSRSTSSDSNPVTTTYSQELLLGYFFQSNNGTDLFTGSNGFLTIKNQNAPNGEVLATVGKTVSSIGTYRATAANVIGGGLKYIITFKGVHKTSTIGTSYEDRLTNGLVGFWTMNGKDISGTTVLDKSGNGFNGNNVGAVTAIGKLGQGLKFDGSSSYVSIADNNSFSPSTFSLGAWIKWDGLRYNSASTKDWATIIAKGSFSSGEYTILMKRDSVESTNALNLYINGSLQATYTTTLDTNWHHLVATYSGSSAKIFLDGANVVEALVSPAIPNSSNALNIGRESLGGSNYFWGGSLDDIRIYNRALSADEVKQLYNMGK